MFPSFAVSSLTPADSENNKERRATTVIYKKKTSDIYLKSFIKNGDGNAEPQRCLRRRNIYVPKGVRSLYSPTKQPKAGSLMRAAGGRAMLRRRCSRAGCDRRALPGEEVDTIYKKKTLNRVSFIKTAMAVRSHSTACDDGTFMFQKESIALGLQVKL